MKHAILVVALLICSRSSLWAAGDGCAPNEQGNPSPNAPSANKQRCQASDGGGAKPMPLPIPPPSQPNNNDNQPPPQQQPTNTTRNNITPSAQFDPTNDTDGAGKTIGGGGVMTSKRGATMPDDPLAVDKPYGDQDYDNNAAPTINIRQPALAHANAASSTLNASAATPGATSTASAGSAGGSAEALSKPQTSFFGGLAPSKGGSGVQDQSWLAAPPGAMSLSPSQQAMLQNGSDQDQ